MSASLDFGLLPPEINSGRMYSGAGSAPMLAAAAAWSGLATELRLTALAHGSVIAALGDQWRGPAAISMAAAAAPYAAWLTATAAQAEQAAAQAVAAATAYETAFAATVPPPVVAANRVLLTKLIATNFLGLNAGAIAATEAHYGEMWAQDAAAMYYYAADSAAASAVTPFDPPPRTADPAGPAAQADAVTQAAGTSAAANAQTALSQLQSAVPATLQSLAAPSVPDSSGLMDWLGMGGADFFSPKGILGFLAGTDGSPLGALLNSNLLNTLSSGFYMPGNYLGTMTDFAGMASAGGAADAGEAAAAGSLEAGPASTVAPLGSTGLGGAVTASLNQASSVGALSVPYGWTAAAPEITLAAQALPGLGTVPTVAASAEGSLLGETALACMAGRAMSGASVGGRPAGGAAAQHRPLPVVIVKPPPTSTG
ncbi:PPE family protein [Mycobacterium sp. E2989]|uniref:PPE family protein n=1 Tax=Mycobacterium sp. E2989 TaxID=1834140 RepID=UPI0007FDB3C9|nr:PPE family protein [Mycobacterium sp. E2989]OBH87488.1 hypothetical protein A5680_03595 [Mycobacterium sp. E2989]